MIKKIIIVIFILSIIFLVSSCINLNNYVPIEKYNSKLLELEEANNIIDNKAIEIIGLKEELSNLENDLDLSNEEIDKYNNLLINLNELLSNVYYGYASNSEWTLDGFTAFSLKYNDKYYIITAGHCVENEYGKFGNFKFKANFSNNWIYPKLLTYENDFEGNRDYAILYSDKITSGLEFDLDNGYPEYVLGNGDNNIFKEFFTYNLVEGESGSPVIDLDGQAIGIATGNFVDINLVIEAIDNSE